LGGNILPLGWDGPIAQELFCFTSADCPIETPICVGAAPPSVGQCRGPNHNPSLGFFLDVGRTDFVFAGHPSVLAFAEAPNLSNYVAVAVLSSGGRLDPGVPTYGGTLRLIASADACGTFTYHFHIAVPDGNILGSIEGHVVEAELHHLFIFMADSDCMVVCGDGQVESGEQCDDGNIVNDDGCSATCQSEFAAIPTASTWGLLALTITLLIIAKIWFTGRQGNTTG
jgi:cysteine-rich repeat protein